VNRIPVLPTLLTLGNGVCGFAAIAYASKITLDENQTGHDFYFLLSAALIFLGMVFDMLDGYAARLSRTASEFGGQLDSLCDAITFGAAPAFLLLRLGQAWNDHPIVAKTVAVIAAVYMACAVLRLARFNVENTPDPASHKRFKAYPHRPRPAAWPPWPFCGPIRRAIGLAWTPTSCKASSASGRLSGRSSSLC